MSEVLRTRPGWRSATLQDLVFFQRGYDITKAEQKPGDIPVVSSSGINSYHSESKVDGPGVVIGRKGSLGTVHYVEEAYWPHDTTLWSKDLKGNHPRFVYYFLHTLDLKRYDVGNSNPTLNRNHIHGLDITIPEYRIQERIADILSAYDDLIENNRRRIQLLEQAARLLYNEWFVHLRFPGHEHITITDGVPEGWVKGTVADFFDTTSGGTPSRKRPEFFKGDTNWVKTQELNEDFIFETEEKITTEALSKSSAKLFPSETLLVSIYGGMNIGRTGILAMPSASNQACVALFPRHPSSNFIFAQLFFQNIRETLIGIAQGAAQTNINQKILRKVPMLMPSKALMQNFLAALAPIYDQLKNLKIQNMRLEESRDHLLPRLMNGGIEI